MLLSKFCEILSNCIILRTIAAPQVFISDRQKGLIDAVKNKFPDSPHAFCVRHLAENVAKKCRKKPVINAVWQAARATTEAEFLIAMNLIKSLPEKAYLFLMSVGVENWTTVYFPGNKYGHVTSNVAESLNSWIGSLGGLSIIPLLENFRRKLADWFTDRLEKGRSMQAMRQVVVPAIKGKLMENQKLGLTLSVSLRHNLECVIAEVDSGSEVHLVCIDERQCSCLEWQRTGYPCAHALAAYHKCQIAPIKGVEQVYHVENYVRTYSQSIMPIPSKNQWQDVAHFPKPTPPDVKKRCGRPRRLRAKPLKKTIVKRR
ncbi:hypothetical protein GEMRC1_010575 [Eukaryota sp. GEM-RC1]